MLNISESKVNNTRTITYLEKYKMRNIFLENHTQASSGPFLKCELNIYFFFFLVFCACSVFCFMSKSRATKIY